MVNGQQQQPQQTQQQQQQNGSDDAMATVGAYYRALAAFRAALSSGQQQQQDAAAVAKQQPTDLCTVGHHANGHVNGARRRAMRQRPDQTLITVPPPPPFGPSNTAYVLQAFFAASTNPNPNPPPDFFPNNRRLFVCRLDIPLCSGQQLHVMDAGGQLTSTTVMALQNGYEPSSNGAVPVSSQPSQLAALNLLNAAAFAAGRAQLSGLSPLMLHSLAAAKLNVSSIVPQPNTNINNNNNINNNIVNNNNHNSNHNSNHNNNLISNCFSPVDQKQLTVDSIAGGGGETAEASEPVPTAAAGSTNNNNPIMSPASSSSAHSDNDAMQQHTSFKTPLSAPASATGDGGGGGELLLLAHADADRATSSAPVFPKGRLSVGSTADTQTNDYTKHKGGSSSSSSEHNVDGINLEEIKQFAKAFKMKRLSLGLTQTQVGQALSMTEGPAYSQSAICRFEKLDITPKSAQKIKPVLEKWMREIDDKLQYNATAAGGPIEPMSTASSSQHDEDATVSDDDLISEMLASSSSTTAPTTTKRMSGLVNGCAAEEAALAGIIPNATLHALLSTHKPSQAPQPVPASCSMYPSLFGPGPAEPLLSVEPPAAGLPDPNNNTNSSSQELMAAFIDQQAAAAASACETSAGAAGGVPSSVAAAVEIGKKRKRRTSFTPQALEMLNRFFEHNTHPSGSEMTALAESLNYEREVVRVWFCNKRQALKNTIKKLKHSGSEQATATPLPSALLSPM